VVEVACALVKVNQCRTRVLVRELPRHLLLTGLGPSLLGPDNGSALPSSDNSQGWSAVQAYRGGSRAPVDRSPTKPSAAPPTRHATGVWVTSWVKTAANTTLTSPFESDHQSRMSC